MRQQQNSFDRDYCNNTKENFTAKHVYKNAERKIALFSVLTATTKGVAFCSGTRRALTKTKHGHRGTWVVRAARVQKL